MCTDVCVVGSVCLLAMVAMTVMRPLPATAASAAEIDRGVDAAVQALYDTVPEAQALAPQARGILVFPKVLKGGFILAASMARGL
jgi:lipid-binding SYLF domain-containing protein